MDISSVKPETVVDTPLQRIYPSGPEDSDTSAESEAAESSLTESGDGTTEDTVTPEPGLVTHLPPSSETYGHRYP